MLQKWLGIIAIALLSFGWLRELGMWAELQGTSNATFATGYFIGASMATALYGYCAIQCYKRGREQAERYKRDVAKSMSGLDAMDVV
jgi:hypothetical protein